MMNKKNVIGILLGSVLSIVITAGAFQYESSPTPAVEPTDLNHAHVILEAPDSVAVGELVTLDVSQSNATGFAWETVPATKNFMVIDGGKRAVFSSGQPGEYLFIIAVAKDGTVYVKTHIIHVGGGPPNFDLRDKVVQWADVVKSPAKRDDTLKLAQSFASVALIITPDKTPTEIVQLTAQSNRNALGANIGYWESFLTQLQHELKSQNAAGLLIDSETHIAAWKTISESLNEYAMTL